MKVKDDLEFSKPEHPDDRSVTIGSPSNSDQEETVKTELTKAIEKLDTSMPLDKVAQEATAPTPKYVTEDDKHTKEDKEREKAMKEIHKTAWDTYQMEKYGNVTLTPEEEAERKAALCNATTNITINGTSKSTANGASSSSGSNSTRKVEPDLNKKNKTKAGKSLFDFEVTVKDHAKNKTTGKE